MAVSIKHIQIEMITCRYNFTILYSDHGINAAIELSRDTSVVYAPNQHRGTMEGSKSIAVIAPHGVGSFIITSCALIGNLVRAEWGLHGVEEEAVGGAGGGYR